MKNNKKDSRCFKHLQMKAFNWWYKKEINKNCKHRKNFCKHYGLTNFLQAKNFEEIFLYPGLCDECMIVQKSLIDAMKKLQNIKKKKKLTSFLSISSIALKFKYLRDDPPKIMKKQISLDLAQINISKWEF